MFVPKGHHVTPQQMLNETIRGRWNLNKPNMFITLDFGMRHPESLSTFKLLEQAAFKDKVASAVTQLRKVRELEGRGHVSPTKREVKQEIDKVIFNRLVRVVEAILDAAKLSNIWIVFDRSTPQAASPTAELVLETALKKCISPPTIVVMDSLHRFNAFRPTFEVNEQLMHVHELLCAAKNADDGYPTIKESPTMYTVEDFERWQTFQFRHPDDWDPIVLEHTDQYRDGDRFLPRRPVDEMVLRDEQGKLLLTKDGR